MRFIILFAISGLLLAPINVFASDWSKKRQIAGLLDQKMREDGVPGLSIAIVREGKLWFTEGYGLANVEQIVPAVPTTLFRSGSLVKPITATAILQLVGNGILDLDDPAWKHCDVFPEKSESVTIRRLLSHTSGLRTYNMPWSQYENELFSKQRYSSVTDAVRIFGTDELAYEPGSEFLYSSYGYNLLGCVIENVTDLSYLEFIEKNILSPAGMRSTVADVAESISYGRSSHYRKNKKGQLIHEQYVDLSNKVPSGGLLSTVVDMARFAQSYMGGRLLSPDLMNYAHAAALLDDKSKISYGAGWEIPKSAAPSEASEIYHSGVTPGATAIMYLYPERQDAIIIMTNLYGVDGREKLIARLKSIMDQ